ncbi:MAG: SDR family oxidoreductase [Polyangiales bacterium]
MSASPSTTGKVCIVTGANTGIGKETARGLAEAGATVVIAVRDVAKGEAAREEILSGSPGAKVSVIRLDLGSLKSIAEFAKTFETTHERLDVLVNNAGVWTTSRQTTDDGFERTFGVNHLGTVALTEALLPVLERSAPSRIVILSSALHYRGKMAWDDLQFERDSFSGTTAYNQSKLANVLFTKALARRLEGKGVTVNAVHPGVVKTELGRDMPKILMAIGGLFMLTPAGGAKTSLYVATSPECASVTGAYFEKSRPKKASGAALDEAAQERLWKVTEALLARPATTASATSVRASA